MSCILLKTDYKSVHCFEIVFKEDFFVLLFQKMGKKNKIYIENCFVLVSFKNTQLMTTFTGYIKSKLYSDHKKTKTILSSNKIVVSTDATIVNEFAF